MTSDDLTRAAERAERAGNDPLASDVVRLLSERTRLLREIARLSDLLRR